MESEPITSVICDIDGVLLHGHEAISGAAEFIQRLRSSELRFLLLTNYSSQTPADLKHRFELAGVQVSEEEFYTSTMALAAFLQGIDTHSEQSVIIGDNMSTDILAGTQAGMRTILVRSGVTQDGDLDAYPFRPSYIFDNVGCIDVLPRMPARREDSQ